MSRGKDALHPLHVDAAEIIHRAPILPCALDAQALVQQLGPQARAAATHSGSASSLPWGDASCPPPR